MDGGLDRRALAVAAEVRAQARAQVASAADVERLVVPVAEQVDAGPRRRALGEATLAVDAALARRRERAQLGQPPRAELLRKADQAHEHLGRRLRVGQRAVARLRRNAEEVGERAEADAAGASLEQAPCERGGAERGAPGGPPPPGLEGGPVGSGGVRAPPGP